MTQTFRSRDEQVNEIHETTSEQVCSGRSDYPQDVYRSYLNRQMSEAEARGAAEERRKDAEGQEPVVWIKQSELNYNWPIGAGVWRSCQLREFTIPLYTRPANVAALESRVKELEGVCRHVVWTVEEHGLGSRGHDSAVQVARAALTREGGV